LAHESGVADVVDPMGGCPYVEALTDEVERRANALLERVDRLGGAVAAIRARFFQREIERSAYEAQKRVESGEDVVVGVNRFAEGGTTAVELFRVDEGERDRIVAGLRELRATRDGGAASRTLSALRRACEGVEPLLPRILDCVESYCTVGEICRAMEEVFSTYREGA
ncbi:MAG: methylmalonyl-CoA mutase family protein, partial [Planctomycetota bacterium]